MFRYLLIYLFVASSVFCLGQSKISSSQLSESEVNSIFTPDLKKELNIDYAIYRVYKYNDKGGEHLLVMSENEYTYKGKKCYNGVKGFIFKSEKGKYTQEIALKDFITTNQVSDEYSMNFWTKFFEIKDYDEDGWVDPIFIYGSNALNGTDDGRIKILVYYKGAKRVIRHQNSTLDGERNTQVDAKFYELPQSIQARVKKIMQLITENGNGIFPAGWEEAMQMKELKFDEL